MEIVLLNLTLHPSSRQGPNSAKLKHASWVTTIGDPAAAILQRAVSGPRGRSSGQVRGNRGRPSFEPCGFRPREREPAVGGSFLCKLFCPLPPPALPISFSAPGVQPPRPRRCLGVAARPAALSSAPAPPRSPGLREPMAEAGRSPAELPREPPEQAAAEVPEAEAPAGPPAPALRRLPGDLSPRGRSQSDLSSCSSRGRPLRVHISGSGKDGSGAGGRGRAGAGRWLRWGPCQPGASAGTGPAGWPREGRRGWRWGVEVRGSCNRPPPSPCRPPPWRLAARYPRPEMLQLGYSRCTGWARISRGEVHPLGARALPRGCAACGAAPGTTGCSGS